MWQYLRISDWFSASDEQTMKIIKTIRKSRERAIIEEMIF
jgi:hypothetical protein